MAQSPKSIRLIGVCFFLSHSVWACSSSQPTKIDRASVQSLSQDLALTAAMAPALNDRHFESSAASTHELPQPVDYTHRYWLGGGYDALSGERRASCLDVSKLEFRSYPVNHTDDAFDIAIDREDLTRKLNVEFNAEVSRSWRGTNFEPTFKGSLLRETSLSGVSLVAIARIRFVKSEVSLYESTPAILTERINDLHQDKNLFREQCGDKYVKGVKIGAELIIVVRAEQINAIQSETSKVNAAVKVGLGKVLGVNASSTLTAEEKSVLNNFQLSTRCYSHGASVHVCADNGLNLSGLTPGDVTISQRINQAKKQLADDILTEKNLTVLDTDLALYPIPANERGKSHGDVFFDYRTDLKNIQSWLRLESRIETLCEKVEGLNEDCLDTRSMLTENIGACADINLRAGQTCRAPDASDASEILNVADGGKVILYEHGYRRGRQLALDLRDLFSPMSLIKPGILYNLHHQPFGDFADVMSGAEVYLKSGWMITFYEHINGSGRAWTIDEQSQGYVDVRRRLNDRVSAFRITRVKN